MGRGSVLGVVTLSLGMLVPLLAEAQAVGGGPPVPRAVTLNLEQALRAALSRSPEVRGAQAEVEGVRGKQLQARGAGYPQVELTAILGPSPRARGDQVFSPDDQYSPDITGVFVRGGIEIVQPLFTWGLITNARLAAEHGVRATQAGVDVRSTDIALRVKEAYWGVVASRAIRDFLLEVQDQLGRGIERAERLVEPGFTTEADVFRLRAYRGDLDKNLNQLEKTLDLARNALGTWTGQPPGTAVEPLDARLPGGLGDLRALELYLEDAQTKRPEWIQLREGLKARRALVEVERARQYPLFFAGIIGSAAYASNRDRLENPYVVDPLRHVAVGPVVGFRYNLDFGIAAGRIKEAEAEVQKLEALAGQAEDGIPLQVRQAYGAVVEARRNAQAFDQAHENAKQWLAAAISNFDLGIGDARDVADAFVTYAKTRGEYLQALYAYVFGLEQLAHAAGLDVDEIRRLAASVSPSGRLASREMP
jgi:outer membrane protein TolC